MFSNYKYNNSFSYWNCFLFTIIEAAIFLNYLTAVDCKLQNESNILLESPANMKQTFNCFDCTMWIGFSSLN